MLLVISVQVGTYVEESKFTIRKEGEEKMSKLKRVVMYGRIHRLFLEENK